MKRADMCCPNCGAKAECVITKPVQNIGRMRRYHCAACEFRFSTCEVIVNNTGCGYRPLVDILTHQLIGASSVQ